ncbi:MAG TPA: histidine kinase [Spirochaetota bacterium]|nr:histidine kinase [Spirochaetota bacterium]HPQ48686.1 histidine kinase [Spirochaetota bacterium]
MENRKLPTYFDIEKNIYIAIDNGKVIRVISYSMSDDIEKKLDYVVENILKKYNKENLKSMIYTAVKELAINGTKANLKRIFFEEKGLDLFNPDDYEKGMSEYKNYMTEEMALKYGQIAKKKGLYVRISFYHEPNGMRIEVVNNTPITPQEEKRLREKMSKIMKYETLMDFYMENQDNTEGAGMGLALVTTMLKAENVDPNLFRIMTKEDRTIARIEIPFNENFITQRSMGKPQEKRDDRKDSTNGETIEENIK